MNIAFAGFRHGHVYTMLENALKAGANVVAAWETDDASKAEAAQHGVEVTYSDYDAMLERKDIDIVAVCDYYAARGEKIIKALKAGKHVYSDKPLCTRADELEQIESLCKQNKLCVGCMLDLRYTRSTAAAKSVIGTLGRIHNIAFCGQHPLNYGKRAGWYFEQGKHGGTINDIAVHGIDLVRYLTGLGVENTLASRCWNAYAVKEPDFGDSAQFMAMMTGGAGLIADVSYSQPYPLGFTPEQSWRFTFWGENGILEFNHARDYARLALKDSSEAQTVWADAPNSDPFADFCAEINGYPRELNTAQVIKSAKDTLLVAQGGER